MTVWYNEWASTVRARRGRMLPIEAFKTILKYHDPGYSSVYSFSEEDANKLLDQESSVGMNKMAVGASCVIMDIDSGEEGMRAIGKICADRGLKFQIWESGGKGYHIVLTHDFIYDKRLPYSHRHSIELLVGDQIGHVDLTLYQHGRLLSLPGRVHPITKKKKTLLYDSKHGTNIDIELLDEPPKYILQFSMENDYDLLSSGLFRAADLVRNPPDSGNRHVRLWSTAQTLADSGLEYDTVLTLLSKVNESWTNPKKSTEVEQAVKSAFKNQT